jgi:hypothetical protein
MPDRATIDAKDFTPGEVWAILTVKMDNMTGSLERIESTLIRIDERTHNVEIESAKVAEKYEALDNQVGKLSELRDRIIKLETPYKLSVWLLGATGVSIIGIIAGILTHTIHLP